MTVTPCSAIIRAGADREGTQPPTPHTCAGRGREGVLSQDGSLAQAWQTYLTEAGPLFPEFQSDFTPLWEQMG